MSTGTDPLRSTAASGWMLPSGDGAVRIFGLALASAGTFSVLLISFGGNVDGAVAIGLVTLFCVAAAVHPRWGYYFLVFVALLADYTRWRFSAWTHQLGFYTYQNWWNLVSPEGVREFDWLIINTVDVLILAIVAGLIFNVMRGEHRPILTHESALTLAFLAVVGVMFAYGLATGGEPKPALWQVRPYFHLGAFALLAPQVLKTRAHVRGLAWIIIAAVCIKAAQINWIFLVAAQASFGEWREILGHEDSVFLVSLISFAVALTLYNVEPSQRRFLQIVAVVLLCALVVNLRRAGYVALAFSLALVPVVLHGRRVAAIKLGLGLAAVAILYCALFWNTESMLGTPVQKVKSILSAPPGSTDYSSNLYRVAESINLRRTIVDRPMGLGFGHPFELHVPLPDISATFPLWQYHPHDMILGMWVSLGTAGFVIFLGYLGNIIMLASHHLRWCEHPYDRAICFFVLASFSSGFLVAAVDQFIWLERGAIFLGSMIGMLSAVSGLRFAIRL